MQVIGIIREADLFRIEVDVFKRRTYWTLKQTWRENCSEIAHLEAILNECSSSFPMDGAVVLDTAKLRIMRPQTATQFLQLFNEFLRSYKVQALAHVGNPNNVLLKMQFERVLRELESIDGLPHNSFITYEDAEGWLDELVMPRSRKITPQGFFRLRAASSFN
ncbi:hypothetical protein U14_02871 [Candidatus Moduliflexus flocculans]|uniref:Uncharacterized protein n=1 Tax=Candidatus Moduliflexus flocculans TaxID=1499966 RepID=A0A081BML0_9BACT|nr:hypothetical protein U14_02871 [Candidatus Moduliflexus flocculans]